MRYTIARALLTPSSAAGLLVALFLWSCKSSGTTAPIALSSATLALHRYNGQRLPFNTGPMPPKGQNPGGCPVLITEGSIVIDASLKRFSFWYQIRNGCTQEAMSQPSVYGSYLQAGSDITYTVTGADGLTWHYHGSVSNTSVTFESPNEALEFRR